MKKLLIVMLALSFVFSGCNKKEEAKGGDDKKAQTQSKQEGNKKQGNDNGKAKIASVKDIDKNRNNLVLFLNRAEHVFEDLQFAAASYPNGKTVKIDGIIYRQLPAAYDTKEKIITYFSRFWSRPLAVRMYDNLHTKDIKGKIYLAEGAGTAETMLITNKNVSSKIDPYGITATVREITNPINGARRTVTYRIAKDQKTKQYEIRERRGTYGQKMFE